MFKSKKSIELRTKQNRYWDIKSLIEWDERELHQLQEQLNILIARIEANYKTLEGLENNES